MLFVTNETWLSLPDSIRGHCVEGVGCVLPQDVTTLLPNLSLTSLEELHHAFAVKSNDMMLVIYLASVIRAILALHNLIENKVVLLLVSACKRTVLFLCIREDTSGPLWVPLREILFQGAGPLEITGARVGMEQLGKVFLRVVEPQHE